MPISAAFSTCSGVPPITARKRAGGHRAGHADLALAADLGARDRGVLLVEDADRRRGEQEVDDAAVVRAGHEARVVVQHRRDDAGRAVGRRGDDAAAGGVLLVDRQRVEVDPVHHRQRIAQRGLGVAPSAPRCRSARAALDLEAAGQDALGARSRARRSPASRRQMRSRPASHLGVACARALVAPHQLRRCCSRARAAARSSSSPLRNGYGSTVRVGRDRLLLAPSAATSSLTTKPPPTE